MASGGQGSDIGARNVAERDIPGHLFRHAGGEGTDLFMDVVQERVGRPATLLLDVDRNYGLNWFSRERTTDGPCDVNAVGARAFRAQDSGFRIPLTRRKTKKKKTRNADTRVNTVCFSRFASLYAILTLKNPRQFKVIPAPKAKSG